MSSFQGVGIEGFHLIHRYHFIEEFQCVAISSNGIEGLTVVTNVDTMYVIILQTNRLKVLLFEENSPCVLIGVV